jgi:SpoVK/Ycf46/Vps4 family AAA+-type ATPase
VVCGQLLSKWVGESQKNIDKVFEEVSYTYDPLSGHAECIQNQVIRVQI